MNKLFTLLLLSLVVTFTHAQKSKVVTAATLLSEGDIAEAKNYIDQAFSSPDVSTLPKAWLTKAEVYADIYKFQMATELGVANALEIADEAFRKAYELDMAAVKKPGKYVERIRVGIYNASIGHFEVGALQFNAKAYESALRAFELSAEAINFMQANKLVKDGDENPATIQRDGYQNAALCALNLADYDKAAVYYKKMIATGTANDKVYANLASILISNSDFEAAKKVIDDGRKLYPENESLAESELNYFIGTDQSDKAVNKLLAAIESNPGSADLYFNLALAYDKLDDEEKMVEAYEKIIELDPTYHGAYLNLGAHYNEKANVVIKTMNDMPDWKEAIKMEPERNKWYNMALPHLEKAHQLMPEDDAVRRALERIYANLNMLDKIEELKN